MSKFRLPAHCPNCGAIFSSGFVFEPISESGQFESRRNLVSCPLCGTLSTVIEGVFEIRLNVLLVIEASELTRSILQKLHEHAEAALTNKTTVQDAVEKISELFPDIGNIFKALLSENKIVVIFAILWMIYYATNNFKSETPSNQTVFNPIIQQEITINNNYHSIKVPEKTAKETKRLSSKKSKNKSRKSNQCTPTKMIR